MFYATHTQTHNKHTFGRGLGIGPLGGTEALLLRVLFLRVMSFLDLAVVILALWLRREEEGLTGRLHEHEDDDYFAMGICPHTVDIA